jgi:glycoside hydrolase-like protein
VTLEGIDYYGPHGPDFAACIAANGKTFVARYLDGSQGRSGKCITVAEREALHAAGLGIALVWERGADPGTSFDQGVLAGQAAVLDALYLGVPAGTVIFIAFDFDDRDPSDQVEFLNGFASELAKYPAGALRMGIYSGQRIIEYAHADATPEGGTNPRWPAVVAYWQTLAWSWIRPLPYVHLYQYETGSSWLAKTGEALRLCGVDVDLDQCFDESVLWKGDPEVLDERRIRAWAREETLAVLRDEYGPALEIELQQRLADNSAGDIGAAVTAAVKAVGEKLTK